MHGQAVLAVVAGLVADLPHLRHHLPSDGGRGPNPCADGRAVGAGAQQLDCQPVIDEILFVEGLKEYVKLALFNGKTVVTRHSMGEMEAILGGHDFLRIHRSYLVSLEKITAFSVTEVEIGNQKLPIGRSYQGVVEAALLLRK
jgi:hypothetical protein